MINSCLLLIFLLAIGLNFTSSKFNNNRQSVHQGSISRLGGIIYVIAFLFSCELFFDIFPNIIFFLLCLPIILIGFIEDLGHEISPKLRFIIMLVVSLLTVGSFTELPFISFLYISEDINYYIYILFFSLCTVTIINGMNLIDGVNGLMALTTISILTSISFIVEHLEINNLSTYLDLSLIFLVITLIFNFPFSKIFFGDCGAYISGFVISCLLIYIFSDPTLLSWEAVLIVIYPFTETVFSVVRRLVSGKNILKADDQHLHSLIFKFLKNKTRRVINANNLTTLILIPLIFFPYFCVYFFHGNLYFIFFSIFLFFTLYSLIYFFFYDKILLLK